MRKSVATVWVVLVVASLILAACRTPEVVEKVVEKPVEVTKIVKEEVKVVVTATPEPVVKEEVPDILGTFPRSETLIARILTGRVGSPDNFNWWVGWKWQDRGIQNLADEALWSVDFATGNIINGLASEIRFITTISLN